MHAPGILIASVFLPPGTSHSPWHISLTPTLQVIVINAAAVTIAMYCVIQFYVQLREPLAEHKPFLKVLAIKLVIFLSFWQASAISVGTSTLHIVHPNSHLAYPDIKVGIPALLLCVEMAAFAILHLWAFPYAPYRPSAKLTFYPVPDLRAHSAAPQENPHQAPSGGFLGIMALVDALNPWDMVKAFGRGVRWLFCGVRRRKDDVSYKLGLENLSGGGPDGARPGAKSTDHLPVAHQFRRSTFMDPTGANAASTEENAGLMDHAQPNPEVGQAYSSPPRPYRDPSPYAQQGHATPQAPYPEQPYDQPAYPPQPYAQHPQRQSPHQPYAFQPGGAYHPYGGAEEDTGYDSYAYGRGGQETGTTKYGPI